MSFSGKSVLSRALLAYQALAYISLDAINPERGVGFGGDGIPVENEFSAWIATHLG